MTDNQKIRLIDHDDKSVLIVCSRILFIRAFYSKLAIDLLKIIGHLKVIVFVRKLHRLGTIRVRGVRVRIDGRRRIVQQRDSGHLGQRISVLPIRYGFVETPNHYLKMHHHPSLVFGSLTNASKMTHLSISATRRQPQTIRGKGYRLNGRTVAAHLVHRPPLDQIDHSRLTITTSNQQIISGRMERQRGHNIARHFVQLNQRPRAHVVQFDAMRIQTNRYHLIIRMPGQRCSRALCIAERVNTFAADDVEYFGRFIIGTRGNLLSIGGETSATHPVRVARIGTDVLLAVDRPVFDRFVSGCGTDL